MKRQHGTYVGVGALALAEVLGCTVTGRDIAPPHHLSADGTGAPAQSPQAEDSLTPSLDAPASSGGSPSASDAVDSVEANPTPRAIVGGRPPAATESGVVAQPPTVQQLPEPVAASGSLVRGDAPTEQSATEPGPFDVDILSSGLRDGPAYGTQTLHVPVGAEPPFASVVIVPGLISPEASIRSWGPFLASHGIVTLTIGTSSGTDSLVERTLALLDGIETLKAEHARPGGPIQDQLALDRFALMGWALGGGATLSAASQKPELRAAISLAAWGPSPRFDENQVPTLLLAGSADDIAGGQSQGFFESIPETTPKMLFEVAGGTHDVANDPRSADGEIGRYALSWLKVFLEGDERYRPFLLQVPSNESEFSDNL